MLSVLLVQPPHRDTFGYAMPPLGPLHLGAAARAAGHRVAFLDLALAARRGELQVAATGPASSDGGSDDGGSDRERRTGPATPPATDSGPGLGVAPTAERPIAQPGAAAGSRRDDAQVGTDDLPPHDPLVIACADAILDRAPDVLGLTAMVSSMPMALDLAAAVKARAPDLPVILGGQGPETVEEQVIARHPAIDAVAVGEADATLVAWLAALAQAPAGADAAASTGTDTHATGGGTARDGTRPADAAADVPGDSRRPPRAADVGPRTAHVPGLVVRVEGRPLRTPPRPVLADLDAVTPPAWDLAESPAAYAAAAGGGEGLFPIDLGRGCTYACSFCTTPVFWGRAARHLSPARAVDELERLAALDGLDCAYVTHDLFTFDRERVLAICAEKRRRGNTLPFECRTRLDLVDGELLEHLADAGCRRILYGVESDSPRVLTTVNKGGRPLDVRAALRVASERGVASIVGVMCGVPGESAEDVEANLRLMADVAVLDGVSLSLHWFNVLPGNGQAATAGALHLLPEVSADLVRGFDLPAGHVSPRQRALIAADPELFAAFRVTVPDWARARAGGDLARAARGVYRLTRNAHLLLEVLPRTLRAWADATGRSLLDTLWTFLGGLRDDGAPRSWDEPHVLARDAAVRRAADGARATGDGRVASLADYERALYATADRQLVRFDVDPLPLVRALDAGDALPADAPGPRAVLFTRRGERVAAHALSPLLADAAECDDDRTLSARWPDVTADTLARAREVLAALD